MVAEYVCYVELYLEGKDEEKDTYRFRDNDVDKFLYVYIGIRRRFRRNGIN